MAQPRDSLPPPGGGGNWPTRPGPQPHNRRVAGTYEEQLARALAPRRPAPSPERTLRRLAGRVRELERVAGALVGHLTGRESQS